MSANRLSWIVVGVVVLVVGLLVVRTVRRDASTHLQSGPSATAPPQVAQAPAEEPVSAAALAASDTIGMAGANGQPRSTVERAKVVLRYKGYYNGPINNNYDPPLAEALKKFQADSGMKSTGYLDHKTYAAMGIILGQRRGMKKVVPKPADPAPSTSPTP